MLFIFEFENQLYEQLSEGDKDSLNTDVVRTVANIEDDHFACTYE